MSDRRLRIYLDDHLALMVAEQELLARCQRSNRRAPLGESLRCVANEVKAHNSIAEDVIHRMGGKATMHSRLKKGAGWFAEKLGRFKLDDSMLRYSDLSRVIELETLAAAAQGQLALWDNLDVVASDDSRLQEITFSFFRKQSQQHLDELNTRRRFAAADSFVGGQQQT